MLSGSVGDRLRRHAKFSAGMSPVYQPLDFFVWWFWFDAYAPHIFVEGAYTASAGGVAAALIAIAMSVWRAREASHCPLGLLKITPRLEQEHFHHFSVQCALGLQQAHFCEL
jgi:type IV secretory pathway TraG/TraD family ATPase VirD4